MLAGLSLSFTQRETNKTCHADLRDFSKFLLGGGWKGGGGRSQPCGLTERKWERPGCLLWGRVLIREVTRDIPLPFLPFVPL